MALAFFRPSLLPPPPSLCSSAPHLRCRPRRLPFLKVAASADGPAVVWFKHDLRIDDHPGLVDAVSRHRTVVPLYVFDPRILSGYSDEMLEQLLFALEDLKLLLADQGSDLLISYGSAEDVMLKLVNEVKATHIFAEEEVESHIRRIITIVESSLSTVSFSWGSPEFVFWRTPFYNIKNLKELPASYRDFTKLHRPLTVPLAAPTLPVLNLELDSGALPTFSNLKLFLNVKQCQSHEAWISVKKISALSKLRHANGNYEENNEETLPSSDKRKKVAKSVFASPKANQVRGGTEVVLNALAAYLRYLEGTARDDWQDYFLKYLDYSKSTISMERILLHLDWIWKAPLIFSVVQALRDDRSFDTLKGRLNRILGEIKEQIQLILETAFENYKSLDESTPLGIVEVFSSATGSSAPALIHAVKLYGFLHDILSPEAQVKLCSYFQSAAKKRSKRHLLETDEFVAGSTECTLMDALTLSVAYQKMKTLCLNIKNEIFKDIEIHDQHMLPSFVDLPNLSASIYSVDLCIRLRAFLVACPTAGPSPHVTELLIATSDFQRDLTTWNICPVKGGVDAKELFHHNIILWIQDKRLSLLESCKLEKVKWSGIRTQQLTTPFVDDMYDHLKDTLNEYDVIICRWPEYTVVLENAIADIEKAVIEAMERHYADVLTPLKDSLLPKKFGLKYVQKLTNRHSICPYIVPDELGTLLNTMKRLLEVLHPKIEMQFRSWGSCIPDGGGTMIAERLTEVTVTLRAKFRNYVQAVVEKLVENTRAQSATKLKKIIQDSKDVVVESDIRNRMQPLKDQLLQTIYHLHNVFEGHVFVAICRGYWDRMGQDMLNFLESRKENRSWYKGARITVSILDDTFASQMQQLLGNAVQVKDLEPPRSVMEVRSMLCKDAANHKDSSFYY